MEQFAKALQENQVDLLSEFTQISSFTNSNSEYLTWRLYQEIIYCESRPRQSLGELIGKSDQWLIENLSNIDRLLAVKEWIQDIFRREPIEVESIVNPWNSSKSKLKSLDPDAPARLGTPLVSSDLVRIYLILKSLEKKINKCVWELVKRGEIDAAIKLCQSSNLHWKAAMLRGGKLFSDPILDENMNEDKSGNFNLFLWKSACFSLSKEETFDLYERATFASLAGDFNLVSTNCNSWAELLWAHYNALIEKHIQKLLIQYSIEFVDSEECSSQLPTYELTEKEIFDSLSQDPNQFISDRANDIFSLFQKHIILNEPETLLETFLANVGNLAVEDYNENLKNALIFVTHYTLHHQYLGNTLENHNKILETYIKLLEFEGKDHLIAIYIAFLDQESQLTNYSIFIQNKEKDKEKYFKCGLESNLDMERISVYTIDQIFQRTDVNNPYPKNPKFHNLKSKISQSDRFQIDSLEWLKLVIESQIKPSNSIVLKLVQRVNTLTRYFLGHGKPQCAQQVLKKYSNLIITASNDLQSLENLDSDTQETQTKEFSQYLGLIECIEKIEEWKENFNSQSLAKESTSNSLLLTSGTSKLSSNSTNWKETIKTLSQECVMQIKRILEADLLGGNFHIPYLEQVTKVRDIYVPFLVLEMHKILFSTKDFIPGNLEESLELANLVSDSKLADEEGTDHHGLYLSFVRSGKLEELLKVLTESSIAILQKTNSINALPWSLKQQ